MNTPAAGPVVLLERIWTAHRSRPYTTTMEDETNISVRVCFRNRLTHPSINVTISRKPLVKRDTLSSIIPGSITPNLITIRT